LFTLVHLCALHPIATIRPTLHVLSIFLQLQKEFGALGLSTQPTN
jgi:hypothetical protein